jgi:uncharacterized protein (TIGR02646 family)
MIKINRPTSIDLDRTQVRSALRRIRQKIQNKDHITSNDFPSHWVSARESLWKNQFKKCCYCERLRDEKREPDIEHFRPKRPPTEDTKDHPGYWWLAYDCDNLLYSCRSCNQDYKKSHFPLRGGSVRARKPDDNLARELPTFIHPYFENPEDIIAYVFEPGAPIPLGRAVGIDDGGRGVEVIRLLGLNRRELLEQRGSLLEALSGIAIAAEALIQARGEVVGPEFPQIRRVETMTAAKQEYCAFKRHYFRSRNLGKYVSNA